MLTLASMSRKNVHFKLCLPEMISDKLQPWKRIQLTPTFQILFIGSLYGTIYLMYLKFKVINFPSFTSLTLILANLEQRRGHVPSRAPHPSITCPCSLHPCGIHILGSFVDFQYLFGVSGHSSSTLHVATPRRSRNHHGTLSVCFGILPWTLHFELGLPLLHRRILWSNCCCGWNHPNGLVCR